MAKKITAYVKLECPAGAAKPSPPVGPALGQHGLNIMEFCKTFNARTQHLEPLAPTPVLITVYGDRTFSFELKTSPATYLLRKAAGVMRLTTSSLIWLLTPAPLSKGQWCAASACWAGR